MGRHGHRGRASGRTREGRDQLSRACALARRIRRGGSRQRRDADRGFAPFDAARCQMQARLVAEGHEYREWQEPRTRSRIVYFYFDPAKMHTDPGAGAADTPLASRLFFEDKALWETAVKLGRLIESGSEDRHYCEALGVVLAHELVRRSAGMGRVEPPARGGLAAWQQRTVCRYIEDHIAEQIPLATLARSVRLSAYHFCRAFKRSFGVPPHRYHDARR